MLSRIIWSFNVGIGIVQLNVCAQLGEGASGAHKAKAAANRAHGQRDRWRRLRTPARPRGIGLQLALTPVVVHETPS